MDGTNRMTLVFHLSHPWGVAVYGSFLYYTDRDYEVIERVDKSTGANKVVLRDNISRLKCLRVYYRDSEYLMWLMKALGHRERVKFLFPLHQAAS